MTLSLITHDITNYKQKGLELHEAIVRDMKAYKKSVFTLDMNGNTFPNLLLMTQAQYDDLNELNKLSPMFYSEDMQYLTPYNIMEVRVDKRNKLTFKEAMGLDDQLFNEWEKSTEVET